MYAISIPCIIETNFFVILSIAYKIDDNKKITFEIDLIDDEFVVSFESSDGGMNYQYKNKKQKADVPVANLTAKVKEVLEDLERKRETILEQVRYFIWLFCCFD